MTLQLSSLAELQAQKAETLPAFGGLNLLHIKRQLADLLKLIGRDGIFDEYTIHDISHVNKMLSLLEWLIPDATKDTLTTADWLMTVLAVYFHDVGLLVTKQEFNRRHSSGFPAFIESVLYADEKGEDYRHKISILDADIRERFLYQEFVRQNHAERIRWWVTGVANEKLGVSSAAVEEISKLLDPLSPQFRRDLGFVAESHHLDDLDDTARYRISQPYGDSEAETVNLQYAAVLLRASDLLHLTGDRTPAILFKLVNPVDPLSQSEWAKQMAVTRVRPKLGLDEEGKPDPNAPRDTIEVHAYFKKEDGFFGLTSYLEYASKELARCHEWVAATARRKLSSCEFPWTRIDDSNIETEGFIRDAFQFTIDQAKILDLLTGHTLYNDSSVVLRELVQNSLDAIRLRLFEGPNSGEGHVKISWNSRDRVLSITDNGTGMTQNTIRDHLLHVGASLYQDPKFKKDHPGFSSISRFGIGVLSTFMIADSVEIITCHPEEEWARRLALRSVHGKYLIRLLEKTRLPDEEIHPHGTSVRLRVRQSVEVKDFLEIARKWIVIPDCLVTVKIDGRDPVAVGFTSPREAIVDYLRALGRRVVESMDGIDGGPGERAEADEGLVLVKERTEQGVTVAYAVRWSPYFHEWSFMTVPRTEGRGGIDPVGVCIEGIRIDGNTPGFDGRGILALANAKGENAPKTNVARSGLEITQERSLLLATVYRSYCKHIEEEIQSLTMVRGHSLTWAINEARFLVEPLHRPRLSGGEEMSVVSRELLEESVGEIPLHLVETKAGRKAISSRALSSESAFWTVTSPFLSSTEAVIRQAPGQTSIRSVARALETVMELPDEPILCLAQSRWMSLDGAAFEGREVVRIELKRTERRLDLMWSDQTEPPRWLTLSRRWAEWMNRMIGEVMGGVMRWRHTEFVLLDHGVEMVGLSSEMAVRYGTTTFYVGQNAAGEYLRQKWRAEIGKEGEPERLPPFLGILVLFEALLGRRVEGDNIEQGGRRVWGQIMTHLPRLGVEESEWDQQSRDDKLMAAIADSDWSVVDPARWEERDDGVWAL